MTLERSLLREIDLISELAFQKDVERFLPEDPHPILKQMKRSRRDNPDDGPPLDEELAQLFLSLDSRRLCSRIFSLAIRGERRSFPPVRPPQANSIPLAFAHENACLLEPTRLSRAPGADQIFRHPRPTVKRLSSPTQPGSGQRL